ncbi:hypothetical protein BX666DRAFT_465681 [Dichotomocladium elegans]|nr:hypothetical protein BX666DRAFT_465681 [Dichotomocladium elegans]
MIHSSVYDFPGEILLMICSYLTARDLEQFCQCHPKLQRLAEDEWLWKSLVRQRFPAVASYAGTKYTSWRQYYMIKDRLQLSAAEDLVIVDACTPFWRFIESRESEYGTVAKLYSVQALNASGFDCQ